MDAPGHSVHSIVFCSCLRERSVTSGLHWRSHICVLIPPANRRKRRSESGGDIICRRASPLKGFNGVLRLIHYVGHDHGGLNCCTSFDFARFFGVSLRRGLVALIVGLKLCIKFCDECFSKLLISANFHEKNVRKTNGGFFNVAGLSLPVFVPYMTCLAMIRMIKMIKEECYVAHFLLSDIRYVPLRGLYNVFARSI